MNPFDLDWGPVSPELYSAERGQVLHVFNFDLTRPRSEALAVQFGLGRVRWFARHLPPGTQQLIRFDDRGQVYPPLLRARLREAFARAKVPVAFTSEAP